MCTGTSVILTNNTLHLNVAIYRLGCVMEMWAMIPHSERIRLYVVVMLVRDFVYLTDSDCKANVINYMCTNVDAILLQRHVPLCYFTLFQFA